MTKKIVTILIVEDSITYQQALKRVLVEKDYACICTTKGEEGLDLVQKHKPDLIILDLLLPGIGGREICHLLKMHPTNRFIPIMMLTMQKEDKAVVEGIEAGADSYVNKNESLESVVKRVQALLKLSTAAKGLLQDEKISEKEEAINLKEKIILLIDDDITYLQGFKRQLVMEGYQVQTGMSGEECLNSLQKDTLDLLLLDLRMPEIDGADVCRQIRKIDKFRDLPIVMLTASDAKEDVIRSFEAGVNDYIVKSGDFRVTKSRVYSIIRRRHFEGITRALNEKMIRQEKLAGMGQLASTLGHELRGSLGIIRSSVYFLKMKMKNQMDEKILKHVDILDQEAVNANRIIEDTLDFARVKPPQLQEADICKFIKMILSKIAIPKNVKVTTNHQGGQTRIQIDPAQMERVFLNLIANACDAMELKEGELTIQSRIIANANQPKKMEISLRDSGTGILKGNLKKIFDPLFTTKTKGTGLGLAVCENIVKAHGGTIEVQSQVDQGTTFTIRLPLEK